MIRRSRKPGYRETRQVTFWAWLPRVFEYKDEQLVVWLEKMVREQQWDGSKWITIRLLTLADAALEKLNPPPTPARPAAVPQGLSIANNYGSLRQALGGPGAQSLQDLLGMQQQIPLSQQQLAQMFGQSPLLGSP